MLPTSIYEAEVKLCGQIQISPVKWLSRSAIFCLFLPIKIVALYPTIKSNVLAFLLALSQKFYQIGMIMAYSFFEKGKGNIAIYEYVQKGELCHLFVQTREGFYKFSINHKTLG